MSTVRACSIAGAEPSVTTATFCTGRPPTAPRQLGRRPVPGREARAGDPGSSRTAVAPGGQAPSAGTPARSAQETPPVGRRSVNGDGADRYDGPDAGDRLQVGEHLPGTSASGAVGVRVEKSVKSAISVARPAGVSLGAAS